MPETRTFRWTNYAASALSGAISAVDTSVVVADGSDFPSPTPGEIFTVVLRNDALGMFEVMNATARSGNTLTVERGAEGTTPFAWPSGAVVSHSLTAAWFGRDTGGVPLVTLIESAFTSEVAVTAPGAPLSHTVSVATEFPSRLVDDLIVFVVSHNIKGLAVDPYVVMNPPSGWSVFLLAYDNSSYAGHQSPFLNQVVSIFYRVVTGTDPDPVFVCNANRAVGDQINAFGMLWRNVDRDIPFTCFHVKHFGQDGADTGTGFIGPSVRMHTAARTGVIEGYAVATATGLDFVTGAESPEAFLDSANGVIPSTGLDSAVAYRTTARYASPFEAYNLFGDREDYTDPLKGWTIVNMTYDVEDQLSSYGRRLRDTAANSRHHAERAVSLVAGQEYSFSALVDGDNLSANICPFLSVVYPDTSEVGAFHTAFDLQTAPVNTYFSAGFSHSWTMERLYLGVRAYNYTFTAPATGTYTFRVGLLLNGTGLTFAGTGASNHEIHVKEVGLRKGKVALPFTKNASTTEGVGYLGWTVPCAYTTGGVPSAVGSAGWALSLTPASRTTVTCEAVNPSYPPDDAHVGRYPLTTTSRLVGGKKRNTTALATPGGLQADILVPPVISGSPSKVYFEVEINVVSGSMAAGNLIIGISPAFTYIVDAYYRTNAYANAGTYAMQFDGDLIENGASVATADPTVVAGDILGCALDLSANEIRFYVNGVASSGNPVAVDTGTMHDLMHWRAGIAHAGSAINGNTTQVTVNFTGPFSYKPVGFLAYDWQNEVP